MSGRTANHAGGIDTLAGLILFLFSFQADAAASLTEVARPLNIDKTQISVSGISSGGFMAHQFHVAHSSNVMGAGIVAGGPYYCAEGSVADAIRRCSKSMALECNALGLGRIETPITGLATSFLDFCKDYIWDLARSSSRFAVARQSFAMTATGAKKNPVPGPSRARVYPALNDEIVPYQSATRHQPA
jgi:hypothetical protein